MTKKAKRRFVTLGEKALSFYDVTSKLQLAKGEATELTLVHRQSRRVVRALKNGHLENVDSEDIGEYTLVGVQESPKENKKKETVVEDWKEKLVYDTKSLMKLKLAQLVEVATDLKTELTEAELGSATKAELVEEILTIYEDYEEDDEDEEGDEDED